MNPKSIVFSKFIFFPAIVLFIFLVGLLVRDFSFTREKVGIGFIIVGLLLYLLEYTYIKKNKQFFISSYITQLFLSIGTILVILS